MSWIAILVLSIGIVGGVETGNSIGSLFFIPTFICINIVIKIIKHIIEEHDYYD